VGAHREKVQVLVYLPLAVAERLRAHAKRSGETASATVEAALAAHLRP